MMHVRVPHEWNTLVRCKTGVSDNSVEIVDDPFIIEGPKRQWSESNPAKSGSRQKRKKVTTRASYTEDNEWNHESPLTGETGNICSANDVCESILRGINYTPRVSGPTDANCSQLDVDHVLSRLPYKQILQDLFGSAEQSSLISRVPIVTRVYEVSCLSHTLGICSMGNRVYRSVVVCSSLAGTTRY